MVHALRRSGRLIAASWALFAIAAAPATAQTAGPAAASNAPQGQENVAAPGQSPQPPEAPPATPAPTRPEVPAASTVQPAPAPRPFGNIFADLTEKLVGSVVNVSTQGPAPPLPPAGAPTPEASSNSPGRTLDDVFREFLGEKPVQGAPGTRATSLGSGFVIDPSGLIVTNNHVVANAQQITVTLSDETAMPAQVVGRDPITDLALLKVEPKTPLPAVIWGDSSNTRVGDWVLTIGNPFGLGGSVTAGIISAVARDIQSSPYDDYLQTDAAINRGNSGGPMFNLDGEVVGVNTVIYSPSGGSIGIGFALPSALVQPIIEQLKATGKVERGWIGTRIQPMTDALAETVGLDKPRGAMIAAIDAGSPAAQAKLQPGDVILTYDGQTIERSRQLPRMVAATAPDKQVKLSFWRDGKEYELELKTAALNPNRPVPPPPEPEKPKPPVTYEAFGVKVAKITPELRKQFSLPDWAKGAVITEVPPNSAAAAQGLRPGDLIVGVGQAPLASPEQVPQLAAAAKKQNQKRVLVRVEQREGSTRFVALPPEAG